MEHHVQLTGNIFAPEQILAILTWAAFFCMLVVLQKFAWKPIIKGLEQREKDIRQSVENADKIKAELAALEASKAKILDEAREKGNALIEQSRKASAELSRQIEERAKKSAEEIITSARQEIDGERQRVKSALKKESVQTAVSLAEKILKENLDQEKNKNLINQALKDI
jgi:F-type H+-transporting ATPase subunit b